MTRTITVDHLARVEGHGGIRVVLDGSTIRQLEFDVFEGIRLFEGLVVGRRADEIPGLVSRICAICSHGHTITALAAQDDIAAAVRAELSLLGPDIPIAVLPEGPMTIPYLH